MTNKKCNLPKGSTKLQKKGYDEVYVPAVRHKPITEDALIAIKDLPEWTHKAFPSGIKSLNTIQSRIYEAAFKSPENLLVCAPTGAGKTNIALLTILQCLNSKRRAKTGKIDIRSFKIVYIAPMKALVSEIVGNFQQRLDSYGIQVRELTGDTHLTKQQIDETQIIVTTPEKWDIVTRKSGERAYVELVKLVIIDEIHLLHDLRGPVLEAIVSRTIRQIETTSELVRIVALSATLPNYEDVAEFLRVKPETGLFHFDNSYRPVPLEQLYVGITEKKAIKRMMLVNEICYEKVMERAGKHQILVFTHSRKETARTGKTIRDMALAQDQLHKFLKEDSASKEILLAQVEKCSSADLKDVLPFGIGIHHAGLPKKDRKMVEDLFSDGHLQVLVSTATLAWGVNLPAHSVIIKGTQIYSPDKGKWVELSPQDVLQMMGRAGRPQYDTLGEGIIITNHSELQYYLSMNNMQLPIESQLMTQLADQLCAEVVLGTVANTKEAIAWLGYTYLHVRVRKNPSLYGTAFDKQDPTYIGFRAQLVHSAAAQLSKSHMIKYDRATGSLQATALGKVASHYYIKHQSMQVYSDNLKPHMNMIDIFRLFALSKEFEFVPIRQNEKIELQKFIEKVPVPVKGSLDEPASKINILLQAYISQFKLEGYDLNADMVYVTQSAGRIMRALFEICLKRGWAQLAEVMLNLCKMVEKRLWSSMTPLRQFTQMPHLEDIARKIEKKAQFSWHHFYEMTAQQLGEIVAFPKMGKIILNQIHKFPRLECDAYVQPLTRTLVRVELEMKAHSEFVWDVKYHGTAEPFWILVQDCDSELILHAEQFVLRQSELNDEHRISFTVPLHDPLPPQYFVKVLSDRWLQSETSLPVSFKHLLLPEKFSPPTELKDFYPRLVKDLQFSEAEQTLNQGGLTDFNSIQTQAFNKLYLSDESVFLGAPSGSGLQTCIELAIFRELQQEQGGKILYVAPNEILCRNTYKSWVKRIGSGSFLDQNICILDSQGNWNEQVKDIQKADIVLTTPAVWETISRRWKQRKVLHQITLAVFDHLHLLSSNYEIIIQRMRLMQTELKKTAQRPLRMVSMSCPIANGKDLAQWMGVSVDPENGAYFNFSPSVRPQPLELSVLAFDQFNRANRQLAMAKPAYNTLKKHIVDENERTIGQGLVFVTDRKQARLRALDFVNFTLREDNDTQFVGANGVQESTIKSFSETVLQTCLEKGIGFIHEGLTQTEINAVKRMYADKTIQILVVTHRYCYEVQDLNSNIVILMGAERYDGTEKRFVDYAIADILHMQGLANQMTQSNQQKVAPKCLLMCYTPRKDYFVKFLQEPLPVESQLADNLRDALNVEIVSGSVQSLQDAVDWLTWSFMYRRLVPNPNFYNLTGRSAQHINDFLSQLVEDTIEDLQTAKCVQLSEDESEVGPANLGRIAAHYGVQYQTIGLFAKYLEDENLLKRKMRALLGILSQAAEFEQVPVRDGEDGLLRQLASYCTYSVLDDQPGGQANAQNVDLNQAHLKTNILLQSHFNRKTLPIDLRTDLHLVLEKTVKLVHAMVDVISTNGFLQATLLAMELSQMVVQAMWRKESPLLQLPGFDSDTVQMLKKEAGVEEIADFMNMEDDIRQKLLPRTQAEMEQLAQICNRYPFVNFEYNFPDFGGSKEAQFDAGDTVNLIVEVIRDGDEDEGSEDPEEYADFDKPVIAQFFPGSKFEDWWVVVGHQSSGKLLAIKKISNFKSQKSTKVQMTFTIGGGDFIKEGKSIADLKLYLMCDSYVGCDIQEPLQLTIKN